MALPAVDEMRSALVTPYRIAFICTLVVFLGGCPFMGLVYEEDLVDEYAVWAADGIEDAAIVRRHAQSPGAAGVVSPMVFAYAWNDDFIIAKQHPRKDRNVDRGTTHWYVVEVASRRVHGPLDQAEFRDLQDKLKIPPELSFKTVVLGGDRKW